MFYRACLGFHLSPENQKPCCDWKVCHKKYRLTTNLKGEVNRIVGKLFTIIVFFAQVYFTFVLADCYSPHYFVQNIVTDSAWNSAVQQCGVLTAFGFHVFWGTVRQPCCICCQCEFYCYYLDAGVGICLVWKIVFYWRFYKPYLLP